MAASHRSGDPPHNERSCLTIRPKTYCRMHVDLLPRNALVWAIAAHVEKSHAALLEIGEHEMTYLVSCELGDVEHVAYLIKHVRHRPVADGLARILDHFREKDGTRRIG